MHIKDINNQKMLTMIKVSLLVNEKYRYRYKIDQKKLFLSNIILPFTAREKVLKNFKTDYFQWEKLELKFEHELEPEPKSKYRKISLKLCEQFLNETLNEERNINEKIFRNHFKYQNLSSLVKDLFKKDKIKDDKIKYMIINKLIKLMKDIIVKGKWKSSKQPVA